MAITGAPFLLFTAVAVTIYYCAPKRVRWCVLLLASAAFYAASGLSGALVLLCTALFTYGAGLLVARAASAPVTGETAEQKAAARKRITRKKRALLAVALIADFSSLFLFKYVGVSLKSSRLLPLGVSFYVFQTAGYLIDLYRKKYAAEKNFFRYLLFVGFFPQMVQGPINRYADMKPQLFDGNALKLENLRAGILRMMFGILKKALVADSLALAVSNIYGGYADLSGGTVFLGAALYCVQLYCDFSGGIDLLCGVAQLFGIRMAENFAQPYFSVSLADFWRRWHISLGEWFKDYLFYPLALSKALGRVSKRARKLLPADLAKRVTPCIATFAVFLMVGVWQGPGASNIAYGLWNAALMSLGMLWVPLGDKLNARVGYKKYKRLLLAVGVMRTNLIVIIGRYFSGSGSLRGALGMLARTVSAAGFSAAELTAVGLYPTTALKAGAALLLVLAVSIVKERGGDAAERFCALRAPVQFALLFAALFVIVFLVYAGGYTPIAYVYENV